MFDGLYDRILFSAADRIRGIWDEKFNTFNKDNTVFSPEIRISDGLN